MAFFEGNKMTAGYGNGPDIINSCSINADKGEIVAILGPNGAGKSTAMKAMLGLLNLKLGSVLIYRSALSKLLRFFINFIRVKYFFINDFNLTIDFTKKTTSITLMAGGFTYLFDLKQNGIIITIYKDLFYDLKVATFFPFHPLLISRSAIKPSFSCF